MRTRQTLSDQNKAAAAARQNLGTARGLADVLGALAALAWCKAGRGGDPDVPDVAALCAWLSDGGCGPDTMRTAAGHSQAMAIDTLTQYIDSASGQGGAYSGGQAAGRLGLQALKAGRGDLQYERGQDGGLWLTAALTDGDDDVSLRFHAETIHAAWARRMGDCKHPFGALVEAWQKRPFVVVTSRRRDTAILPRVRFPDPHPDRQRGLLIGGVLGQRDGPQPTLPLWPDLAPIKRVPLLDIVDGAGVPVFARGRGVPLPARLFVRALAFVAPEDRRREHVRIAVTLHELVAGLFPKGDGRTSPWRPGRDWPKLVDTLRTARDYGIPDGDGALWFALALRQLPETAADMDALVVLDVAFPPGSHTGPMVDLPYLDRLSVTSAPEWRAYIGAASVMWIPGKTRVPAPRGGRSACLDTEP